MLNVKVNVEVEISQSIIISIITSTCISIGDIESIGLVNLKI